MLCSRLWQKKLQIEKQKSFRKNMCMKLNKHSRIQFPAYINAAAILSIIFFAGCRVAKPDPLPQMRPMPSLIANAGDTQQISNLTWRQFFTDPHLLALID